MQSSASSTSPTTTSPSKTYRYAPKSVIANTYMRKLGSNALEQYRKNMSALYSSSENQPTATVQPITAQDETSASSPYNIDPERARLAYATRPNAPRPLRRRLSSGEVPQAGDFQRVSNMTQAPGLAPVRSPSLEDEAFVRHEPNNNHKEDESAKESCHMPRSTSLLQKKKGNLKKQTSLHRNPRNVTFDPLALLLDASLEGELDLVKRSAEQVPDPSTPNDEGITALHNAICAGHYEIVKFLIEFGCDVNAPDSDGWTPLHCAASCNNLPMVKFLVEHGACIFAQTISDQETAAEKCEEDEDGFDGCSQYLYGIQEKLGSMNKGCVFAVFDYEAEHSDELSVKNQDKVTIVRRGDEQEVDWWWAKRPDRSEGYLPKNLLGLCPRVIPKWLTKK
ncbi:hypothetical protein CAPTEDRAFT_154009 [Capitella teleta]|uniref:SH3 domain-containing protein n=1 Tax=Capitella teleta TaxID=283909 RepID=R7U0G0_CAPTE|nr:hypothetical protein CAPTEDRAFT_154009 [Capitella teleta]|eukprot:ELT99489.1 hypothetical protein CAPTEDRAFT_154009 [Capitella teleta]